MIRADAQVSVSKFADLVGVPRRTYCYRLAKLRRGDSAKGAVARAGAGPHRARGSEARSAVPGLGAPQDLGDGLL